MNAVIKAVKDWALVVGIVAVLLGGAVLSWIVLGSVPPNCHKKLDPGFCITRKKKTFEGPGRPNARIVSMPVLVSLTPR